MNNNKIYSLSTYHKYWIDKENEIQNPNFDDFSRQILALKGKDPEAIEYFFEILNEEFPEKIAICAVPSSTPGKTDTGITNLAKKLTSEKNRIDRVNFLIRTQEIPKLAYGGNRDQTVHYQSIDTEKEISVKGMTIFLLDDVTTTGNSLIVCKEKLLRRGAATVIMVALGQTDDYGVDYNYESVNLLEILESTIIFMIWLISFIWGMIKKILSNDVILFVILIVLWHILFDW
ncbi:phosphoribosyltransferase [Butyrivibrio sp. AC2005]|uniref:phosphoribosyltransferase n=1 Tax=Butyrivibrio sp. AC2005 TaxID=1280672 RepID=UPI00041AFCED|nr:phosphoribosyltransferase family protein [Butyrivibrio sp. AC2005]